MTCEQIVMKGSQMFIARRNLQDKPSCPAKMADLEAVLADVSYLMAMEKSKSTPAARASKKIILPDPSYVDYCDRF